MKFVLVCISLSFLWCACSIDHHSKAISALSPNGAVKVALNPTGPGLSYSVHYKDQIIVNDSKLGLIFQQAPLLGKDMIVESYEITDHSSAWAQPWGQNHIVEDKHTDLHVTLKGKGNENTLQMEFKVFDDGVGFRYRVPSQNGVDSLIIMDELTEFAFADDHEAWHIPAFFHGKYEQLYEKVRLSELETAETPLTLELNNGLYASIHEAALVNYSSMALRSTGSTTLESDLYPWQDGTKVKLKTPFSTPWRTIQIAESPGGLIESNLILNLNEPNQLGDVSWVNPMKYVGIWWGMHIGKWTWNQGHDLGATTSNTIKYIDFAAKHGFSEVLVEGWNAGFEEDWHSNWGPNQDFTQPHSTYDLKAVQNYAQSKGVTIQAYNETCANTTNYLNQIDSAFSLYRDLGYKSVKVGHVNQVLDTREWHHGQYGVNYFQTVIDKAAEYQLAINFHEAIKATGLRRTYPNMVARECARGQEFNAWAENGGNTPEHLTILPFTRILGGPMDFTPGIFQIDIPEAENNQVNTTISKQLALYVVIFSPIQMAADLIENYRGREDALQFIKDVPVNWEKTKILDGVIGDYIITARKDINSEDWYLGAISDEQSRSLNISLDFLDHGQYEATVYRDGDQADYQSNPMDYVIESSEVAQSDSLSIKLARSGGVAIRFRKLNP